MSLLLVLRSEAPVEKTSSDAAAGLEAHSLATTLVSSEVSTHLEAHSLAAALTGADSQAYDEQAYTIRLRATATVEVWENGVFRQNLGSFLVADLVTLDLAFDATLLADPTGAGVELRVHAGYGFDVSAVVWDASYISAEEDVVQLTSSDSAAGLDAHKLTARPTSSDTLLYVEANQPVAQRYTSSDSFTALEVVARLDKVILQFDVITVSDEESVEKPPKVLYRFEPRSFVGRASFDLR